MRRIAIVFTTVLVSFALSAQNVSAAPGNGFVGACNMLVDATMASIPMAHDAAQGNAGMSHAVAVSGTPGCQ
jgi:hypothetical protein